MNEIIIVIIFAVYLYRWPHTDYTQQATDSRPRTAGHGLKNTPIKT
jgi:hypothetical protein